MVRDAELVEASLDGSPVAFAVLVTRHRERARRTAAGVLRDPHEAEDVAQEALLQAYVGLAALRERDRFGAWLAGIAANLARMRARSRSAVPVPGAGLDEPQARDTAEDSERLDLVQAAVQSLPDGERRAVLACDVLGLTREEAGAALGCSPGAVRVRLHRARARLRAALRDHVPMTMPTEEERAMIEMEVRDVLSRANANGSAGEQPSPLPQTVVLLEEKGGERVLPIWVGAPEAGSLVLERAGEETPRPMSADLMARIVQELGGRVERVVVSSLRESTFFGAIALDGATGRKEVDARPSDALNLAQRLGAPIYVDERVLDEAGLTADDLAAKLDREEERVSGAAAEGEWRSVSPTLVRSWFPSSPPPLEVEGEAK